MQTQNCDNCIPYDTDIKTVIICKIQLYKSPSYHQMVVVVCRYFSHPATNSLLRLLPNHKIGIGVQMMVCILDFLPDICHKSVNFLLRPAEVAAEECVGVGSNSLEHIHLVIQPELFLFGIRRPWTLWKLLFAYVNRTMSSVRK